MVVKNKFENFAKKDSELFHVGSREDLGFYQKVSLTMRIKSRLSLCSCGGW
jgi:hypothetical protein